MAVRIRMKRLGRRHRPFYRICAVDGRAPRDGKVIEELGYYDPMLKETDARAVLNGERIAYWLSVGAQPSDNVRVLIKKYGQDGTHVEQQHAALDRLKTIKPMAPPPQRVPTPKQEEPAQADGESAPEGQETEQAAAETQAPQPEAAAAADAPATSAAPEGEEKTEG